MKNRRIGMWIVLMNIPLWGTGFAMRAGERLESSPFQSGMEAYRKGNTDGALDWFKESCISGEAMGCVNLGHMVEHGEGTDAEPHWAERFYREACDLGSAAGCTRLSELQDQGGTHASNGMSNDLNKATKAAQSHEHALIWGVSAASVLLDWERGDGVAPSGR